MDALSDLVRAVGDDSPPEHRAIFHLWSALDDIEQETGTPYPRIARIARDGLDLAATALTSKESRS